jgi:hypothetical protein
MSAVDADEIPIPISMNFIKSEYSIIQIKFQSNIDKYANMKTIASVEPNPAMPAEMTAKFLVR